MVGDEKQCWPDDPDDVPIAAWDTGVFVTELTSLQMLPHKIQISTLTVEEKKAVVANPESLLLPAESTAPKPLEEGTFRGTQLALTKVYELIESEYLNPPECRDHF